MIFTILTLLFSIFGAGFQAATYIDAQAPAPINGGVSCNYELNDVPGSITLQIDGYEIAYPIKSEIHAGSNVTLAGAAGHNPATNPHPHLDPPLEGEEAFSSPPDKEGWRRGALNAPIAGVVGMPRYYILAEPILYRRAGQMEWQSFYTSTRPPSLALPTVGEGTSGDFKTGD